MTFNFPPRFATNENHVNSKMADNEEPELTPEKDIVVTKYKMTGDMVNGKIIFTWLVILSIPKIFCNHGIVFREKHVVC